MNATDTNWWERTGNFVSYPDMQQGDLDHCVYAAIAGGINHIAQRTVWTPQSLYDEYQKDGPKDAHFGVANTALERVANEIEKYQHNRDTASQSLTPSQIREWIEEGSVVILSMELRNDSVSNRGGWHMFSLMAIDDNCFQVWDTNGGQIIGNRLFEGRGFLRDDEIASGFSYPNGWFFMPHDKEDTLVLKQKA